MPASDHKLVTKSRPDVTLTSRYWETFFLLPVFEKKTRFRNQLLLLSERRSNRAEGIRCNDQTEWTFCSWNNRVQKIRRYLCLPSIWRTQRLTSRVHATLPLEFFAFREMCVGIKTESSWNNRFCRSVIGTFMCSGVNRHQQSGAIRRRHRLALCLTTKSLYTILWQSSKPNAPNAPNNGSWRERCFVKSNWKEWKTKQNI